MSRERRRPPALGRELVWACGCAAQSREHLFANALDIRRVEPRRRHREPKQFGRFALVVTQGAQRAGNVIAGRREAELNRLGLKPLMKGVGLISPAPSSSKLAVIVATPGLLIGSWFAPPRNAKSSAISGTEASRTSQASIPRELTMRSIVVASAGTAPSRARRRRRMRSTRRAAKTAAESGR